MFLRIISWLRNKKLSFEEIVSSPQNIWYAEPLFSPAVLKGKGIGTHAGELCSSYLLTLKYCSCSVAKLYLSLCNPMDCSTPGFPVLHCLPELGHTRPLSRWCHPTISSSVVPFSSCPQSFPASEFSPMSWLFASSSQSIEASASASVLPVGIQGWFPLWLVWSPCCPRDSLEHRF